MSDDIRDDNERNSPASFDDGGFAGYTEEFEGDSEQQHNPRLIQGTEAAFTNESQWVDGNDQGLPPGLRVVPWEVKRVVQKWVPGSIAPVETIILEPGQPFPDVKEMNKQCPQTEWGTDLNGNPRGPWQIARFLYFIDPDTLNQYTFIASNVGSTRAVEELVRKIRWAQKYKRADVLPLLEFSKTWMPTRYGGRHRPHFQIVDWWRPSGGGVLESITPLVLSGPTSAAIQPAQTQNSPPQKPVDNPPPQKPAQKPAAALDLQRVKRPTLAEELDDEIPI